jgi:hypothetical protein
MPLLPISSEIVVELGHLLQETSEDVIFPLETPDDP